MPKYIPTHLMLFRSVDQYLIILSTRFFQLGFSDLAEVRAIFSRCEIGDYTVKAR